MSSYDREAELPDAFYRAVNTVTRGHILVDGKIEAVDKIAFTCTVNIGDSTNPASYYDVPLRILKNEQSTFVEIPQIGTNCIICFIQGNLGRPKLHEIHESESVFINCNDIQFNNGKLGGLVVVKDLVDKLNKIEKELNALKNVMATWAPVPGDGGAALKSAASSWFSQQLSPTQIKDIENPKIKQ